MEPDVDVYRRALADARADLAEAQERLRQRQVELETVDTRIRKLRAVIYALSLQLGVPHDLPMSPEPQRRRGKPWNAAARLTKGEEG